MLKIIFFIFSFFKSFSKNPVLFVPGIFASDLFYKDGNGNLLDNEELVQYFPPTYDEKKNEFVSSVPVTPKFVGGEFGSIVNFGVSEFYIAPYDYRTESYSSMKKAGGLFERIQSLIERMYSENDNSPVVLFSHSLGCSVTRHFLANYANQTWKDQYVKIWIAVSGTFGGVPSAFNTLISSAVSILYLPIFQNCSDLERHDFAKYMSALYFVLPNAKVYQSEYVLAHVKKEGILYTIKNMTEAFKLSFDGELEIPARFALEEEITEFNPPNVETHVYYGSGLPTMGSVEYDGGGEGEGEGEEEWGNRWWEEGGSTISVEKGLIDGDTVVPTVSMSAPRLWEGKNSKPLRITELPGADHGAALFDPLVMSDLADAVNGEDPDETGEDKSEKTKKKIASKDVIIYVLIGAAALAVSGWLVTVVACVVWRRKQRGYAELGSSEINN